MKEEKWKPVSGYNYAVSSTGKVKSFHSQKIIKPFTNHKGYLIVTLSKDGRKKNMRIHRLVAQAFIDNSANLPEVDHINGERQDNRVENLRWASGSSNTRNREVCRTAKSKFNGVTAHQPSGKWQASAWLNGKNKYIGLFAAEIEAALAFNKFCLENKLNRELNLIEEAVNECN